MNFWNWKLFRMLLVLTGQVGQRAMDAEQKATDAEVRATAAHDKVNYILNRLPQDKRNIQELASDTVNTNKDTNDAMEQSK